MPLARQAHEIPDWNNGVEIVVRLDDWRKMAFVHKRRPHRLARMPPQTFNLLLHFMLDFAAYLALPIE